MTQFRRRWKSSLLALIWCFFTANTCAQITAESQGGQLTLWTAVGFDKEIGESKWTSVTDFGFGRHSDPNNWALLKRQGLAVVTQDFAYRFNRHWRATISAGYWHRDYYTNTPPYDHQANEFRNEFRPFQRVYYDWDWGRVKFSNQVRTDYRFFFTPGFARWPTTFEFRQRDMIKATIPIGHSGRNFLIPMYEILAGKDEYGGDRRTLYRTVWSNMTWLDNRPAIFVRHHMEERKADFDLGVMYQRVRSTYDLHWDTSINLMVDIVFR